MADVLLTIGRTYLSMDLNQQAEVELSLIRNSYDALKNAVGDEDSRTIDAQKRLEEFETESAKKGRAI